ncbi:type I-U CRISPR-associated protein Csb2 [Spirulina sp. CS-785/01]|uniref:type I-G CRISPR-associated protein Csb2 n=1 Tax=Spirulina sp. CS-785/01 TaxID=3021716 RepID=UPI00232B74B3|nr:type I-U CRISPR-associated protein Csb2 [Spirulina sp. CS-785/01]MDB9312063.1 type I-U CRISPR-associated protein Csb2 [Spirulina sp. CS-785/01]
MITLSCKFLAGRYHATPWTHQVNEGVVEWPPSPWRILRALVSAYYRLPETPDRRVLLSLLSQLSNNLPHYSLPNYTEAHTRHYMPIRREGKNKTTRVLDTFYVIHKDDSLMVWWPDVTLAKPERGLLEELCGAIAYLGRAESWVEITVKDEKPELITAFPMTEELEDNPQDILDTLNVLVPLDEARLTQLQDTLGMLPKPKKKRGKKSWTIPRDIVEVLELDIGDLHAQGWNGIPGGRWVRYGVQETSLKPEKPSEGALLLPNFARFRLVSETVKASVLPPLTQAIAIGDRLHKTLNKISDGLPVFSGKDQDGNRLQGHQHAFFLPEDADGDGKIDHILVWAKEGFNPDAVQALAKVRKIYGGGISGYQLVLLAVGRLEEQPSISSLTYCPAKKSQDQEKSYYWRSLTPLIFPRYPHKKNGRYQREEEVQRLLGEMGFPDCQSVELLPKQSKFGVKEQFYGSKFWRNRLHGKGSRGPMQGYGFKLVFKEEVKGPIALGYGAHFGLGVFRPE